MENFKPRIWVMDRGMVSEKNLAFLRKAGRRYLVGTPKGLLKKYEQELLSDDWHKIREGIEVKPLLSVPPDEDDEPAGDATSPASTSQQELFILCRSRSRDRVKKDFEGILRGGFGNQKNREEGVLRAMAARCEKQCRDTQKVEREVGPDVGTEHTCRETSSKSRWEKQDVTAARD